MAYIPTQSLAQAKDRSGKSQAYANASGIKVGKVIDIDRRHHAVDVVLQTGETLRKVPVASSALGTRSGRSYIAKFSNQVTSTIPHREQGTFSDDKLRTIYCIIDYVQDNLNSPVVIGFLLPETNQMEFDREGFSIDRHETDQYSMTETDQESTYDRTTDTKLSNFEWVHPSGFWIRVGRGTVHEDLTVKDTQKSARFRGTANANTPMRSAGPDTVDYVPITVKHPSGTGVQLDQNFNILTGPGGEAQVNGCEIVTECNLINYSMEPVCDVLGSVLVDVYGNPVMARSVL